MSIIAQAKWLTCIMVLINAAAMLSPMINSGDAVNYAALSQHIALHGDWINLVLDGKDWLDKPHLPFWITALSFKLGGISPFTYVLPGFLFHLIGAYFTFRIARRFHGRDAAWLAVLVYVSTYQLMDTSIEVKAETYLSAFIMGACYYWLRYDAEARLKYLLLGALFSAMAMMTKGLFTAITISSGLVCMWVYQKQWYKLRSGKWWLALVLTLLFIAPELIALYLQFDAHPEKVAFGQTHVSGIKFFFWDSQFGRFFNTGPIQNRAGNPAFFVFVFLWAFLPWTVVFIAATYENVRTFLSLPTSQKASLVFLYGAFLVTFVLFSATRFQTDRYTAIVFPFAAILCGNFLAGRLAAPAAAGKLVRAQLAIAILLVGLSIALSLYVGRASVLTVMLTMLALLLWYVYASRGQWRTSAILVYPAAGIAMAYVFLVLTTLVAFSTYGIAYNVNALLGDKSGAPIYVYQMEDRVARELGLYNRSPCYSVASATELPANGQRYFLVIEEAQLRSLEERLGPVKAVAEGRWAAHHTGLLFRLLRLARGTEVPEDIRVVEVGA